MAQTLCQCAPGGSCGSNQCELGVVIVDHGSRRPEANAMLEEFVVLYW